MANLNFSLFKFEGTFERAVTAWLESDLGVLSRFPNKKKATTAKTAAPTPAAGSKNAAAQTAASETTN